MGTPVRQQLLIVAATVFLLLVLAPVLGRLVDEKSSVHGRIAVGVAADGRLIVRSTMCDATAPADVTVTRSTAADRTQTVTTVDGGAEVQVDLPPTLDPRSTITVASANTDGVVVTPQDWKRLDPGSWIETSSSSTGDANRIASTENLSCD